MPGTENQQYLITHDAKIVVKMERARLNVKVRSCYRRLIAVSVIITLMLYLPLFRGQHFGGGVPTRPINQQQSTAGRLSGGNSSITLVVSSTSSEHTEWIASHFPNITSAIYVVDSTEPHSSFRTPMNKGNEAMVYLTYIIDNYNQLPDVAIFIHAHLQSKHTDNLLGNSIVETVQRLRISKVRRDGYFNLRCNWMPGGCPLYLNLYDPTLSALNGSTQAQVLKKAWSELFSVVAEMPEWVGQPYGGQFAASRDAIRRIPLQGWIKWREWLISTNLTDYDSGRVWEYTWQYVLAEKERFCPSMYQCYCEGYGVCFSSDKAFEDWRMRGQKLEEKISKYLLMQPTGRKAVEMKKKLMKEKDALDRVLKDAKDRGDRGG